MSIHVQFTKLDPGAAAPERQHADDSGWDLRALDDAEIPARGRVIVPTGIAIAIPTGWEGQVRPRSGLAIKRGITVLNAPGTIDAGYRGEVKVILFNTEDEAQHINAGERIAQLVICPVASDVTMELVDDLSPTKRGEGGFGHTGTH